MPLVKDLLFRSTRQEIVPKLQLGIFQDLWLSASLPIVVRDTRSLSFDQRATPCIFPDDPEGRGPTCINARNSTTIADELLPPDGFDSLDPGQGFDGGGSMIFRGPNRAGLDQVHLGLGWAPMNQLRDSTKPTWKIEAQLRVPMGKVMRFNRAAPNRQTGVSRGVTEVRLQTSMAKNVGWAEPYFEMFWQAPLSVDKSAPLAALDPAYGATSMSPQQRAGTTFGVEAVVWESPEDRLRVAVDGNATFEAFFEGRGYSDMWEVFAFAGDPTFDENSPLVLDADPQTVGGDEMAHPGVTNIENYMTLTTRAGVTAHAGERVRFGAHLGYFVEQSHLISFADAGRDLPPCSGGSTMSCEPGGDDDVVDPNSIEVNPLYAPTIDVVGHRYRVSEARTFLVLVDAQILF
jgi:hypothetical protein